jgi:hypothetical protein
MKWIADEHRSMVFNPVGHRNQQILAEFKHQTFGG